MILENQNVLMFPRTMGLGGTENVVLQLCEILQPVVHKIVVCSCGGVNVKKLSSLGIKHYRIPDIENKTPQTVLSVSNNLLSIVKKENITIIHTHHRMAAFYVRLLRLYKRCKFINTSHNTFTNHRVLTMFAYKKANLIACGEMVKANLVNYYNIPEQRVTVIHNAVKSFSENQERDPFIEELHNNGFFIVGNIGRLSEQKGFEYYIKSVPIILAKHPNTRFLIIGSGEKEQYLRNLVKFLSLNEYVFFLGYRTDIQNIMSQIDLVVLSSLWEGFPLTPIEAFSVDKTIVATAVDGTKEIVDDGKTGLLIPPRDPQNIANKVSWVIENPEERRNMEIAAKYSFNHNFSFDIFKQKYISYYAKNETISF